MKLKAIGRGDDDAADGAVVDERRLMRLATKGVVQLFNTVAKVRLPALSLPPSLPPSLPLSLPYSLTHSLTHSLTPSLPSLASSAAAGVLVVITSGGEGGRGVSVPDLAACLRRVSSTAPMATAGGCAPAATAMATATATVTVVIQVQEMECRGRTPRAPHDDEGGLAPFWLSCSSAASTWYTIVTACACPYPMMEKTIS